MTDVTVIPAENAKAQLKPQHPRLADSSIWQPVAGSAIVVAGMLYAVWLLWRGFYYVDDFLRLTEASRATLDWSYLSDSVFGHFVPGWRLTFYLLQRGDPLGYDPVIVLTAVFQGVALIGFLRLVNALFGRRWRNLIFLTWLAVSPAMLPTQLWLASALHVLPSMALTLWSLDGFVRYLAARRTGYLAYSVASMVFGLMFYEKPVIVLVLMPALILVVATQTGALTAGLRMALQRMAFLWRAWIAYCVPLVLYFWYFFTHGYYAGGGRPPPGALLHATWLAWLKGVGPTLVGGPFRWQVAGVGGLSISHPSTLTIYLALGVFVIAVIGSLVVNDRAWRGWAFLVVGFSASFVVAAWGRLVSLGLNMALDFRYTADTLPVVLLGIALACTPIRRSLVAAVGVSGQEPIRASAPARHRRGHVGREPIFVSVALIVVVAYLGASAVSIVRYRSSWNRAVSRPYWHNVESGIDQLRRSGRPFSLYNVVVPDTVELLSFYPNDLLSATAGLKYPHLSYDDLHRPLYVPDPVTGVIKPATFVEFAGAAAGTPYPLIVPPNGSLQNGAVCLPPGLSRLIIPLQRSLPLQVYDLMVHYRSVAQSAFTPFGRPTGTSPSRALSAGVQLPASNDAVVIPLAPTSFGSMSVVVSSNGGICFQSITIGLPGAG